MHLHQQINVARKLPGMFLLLSSVYFASAAGFPPSARQGMVERAVVVMEKVKGFDEASLDALCRHYGFSYSQGKCKNAKAGVPVDALVEVAACHYPELGEVLSQRRNEVVKLRKLCGKNGTKLKNRIATYASSEAKLQEQEEASESRQKRYKTALDKAASALAAVDRSLRKVEEMDGRLTQVLAAIRQGGARTDVSLVKGKGGYRLSANVSTTTSPDAIIREQQYVWVTCEKEDEYDEGIDL